MVYYILQAREGGHVNGLFIIYFRPGREVLDIKLLRWIVVSGMMTVQP